MAQIACRPDPQWQRQSQSICVIIKRWCLILDKILRFDVPRLLLGLQCRLHLDKGHTGRTCLAYSASYKRLSIVKELLLGSTEKLTANRLSRKMHAPTRLSIHIYSGFFVVTKEPVPITVLSGEAMRQRYTVGSARCLEMQPEQTEPWQEIIYHRTDTRAFCLPACWQGTWTTPQA